MALRPAGLVALLAALAAGSAQAAETGLSGMWMIEHDSFHHRTKPELTPEAAAYAEAASALLGTEIKGYVIDSGRIIASPLHDNSRGADRYVFKGFVLKCLK